jgi:hypothetical protein
MAVAVGLSRIDRYPDTATQPGAIGARPGHSVGKQCRENYVA